MQKAKNRIEELDYLKCIFIILMIIFHLVYIGDKYPYLKKIVYTFHMPAFLLISGYLANVQKKAKHFLVGIFWIFVPYTIMEVSYVVMSSLLPVREKVAEITLWELLTRTFISPLGPYWYLHTLILCSVTSFIIYNYFKFNEISRLVLLGCLFFILSYVLNLLVFANAMYFLIGVAICRSKLKFTSIFQPSALAVIPLIALLCFSDNLNRFTLSGVAITYLVISTLLYLHSHISNKMKAFSYFIGQNTLVIFLFSPIFTMMSKMITPLFSFDNSGICFMCAALLFTIVGCIIIAILLDRLNLSQYFFGKEQILNRAMLGHRLETN